RRRRSPSCRLARSRRCDPLQGCQNVLTPGQACPGGVCDAIGGALGELGVLGPEALREQRYQKFRALGQYME
ncbi:MAG TPA: hypothetical protein VFZ61_01605, partial [Polyangiales bacterium]